MEFKAGQGSYMQKQLKEHVAKYICAFLNSEGGTLLVGVNDSGEVLGIQCTQHIEDLLRQKMDATIKEIAPQVFPNMYTIDFVPVCDIAHVPLENRKVLEITVKQTSMSSLYQTHHGHVFVRRDGSVQGPLKASDIQEWTRMVGSRLTI
ncbi:hypothetical protein NP493_466g05029 [Ridgeia piscesae]|uniref:Schlafen AlbA-2 domain-containing protein n=1 Tax=Ridgeia piscesae TaxID=27915 RepID=A0AAD9KYC9_RIDPI|nr:hypothetical protein NP493_466g05029 [Ridgeia piscesae]